MCGVRVWKFYSTETLEIKSSLNGCLVINRYTLLTTILSFFVLFCPQILKRGNHIDFYESYEKVNRPKNHYYQISGINTKDRYVENKRGGRCFFWPHILSTFTSKKPTLPLPLDLRERKFRCLKFSVNQECQIHAHTCMWGKHIPETEWNQT